MLFPEDLRGWLPVEHIVHFIIEAARRLDLSGFKVNSTGSKQYPLRMMVIPLLYCYAVGDVQPCDRGSGVLGCGG